MDEPSYNDNITGLTYISDKHYIDSGESHSISSKYKTKPIERQFWYVRSFPKGNRNCYAISNTLQGHETVQYLIRVRFMYGNYDRRNRTPKFDLYVDSTFWDSVEFENASSVVTKEIIYSPMNRNYYEDVHVCVCDSKNGTPFVSVLEVRVITGFDFGGSFGIAEVLARFNLGSEDGEIIRYPNDVHDRIWTHYISDDLKRIGTSHEIEIFDESYNESFPPSIVLRTAATPANASNNIRLHFLRPRIDEDDSRFYALLYFAEFQKLRANEIREFNIFVDGKQRWPPEPYQPAYLRAKLYDFGKEEAFGAEPRLDVWIDRTGGSTLPPILNAIEIFTFKNVKSSETHRNDYDAIKNIKKYYQIKSNWQGDPCTPMKYRWEGLDCESNVSAIGTQTYRIRSLNLSWSALRGKIAPRISDLLYITHLDLSNNRLTGDVPDFLLQLKYLRFLNIEGNELSGAIPAELTRRSNNGLLQLRCQRNRSLCCPSSGKKKHKNNIVIPVAASFGGAFIIVVIVVAAVTLSIFFKRRQVVSGQDKLGFFSDVSKRLLLISNINKKVGSKKQQLTYAEILNITNNFEKFVGKGGFGTVYHGYLGNTQVAVKMLSPSTQGFLQFEAEANLLTRVHHKCLTPLLGYCHEGPHIALVYEYMPNGDLANYLSDSEKLLSWKQRIQIAVDAAEGLEYLHNGCKPPIVHRDIKPRNILLNENLRCKIADFGLSKIFPNEGDTHVFTVIAGTPGYLDPKYYASNKLNEKTDVFSFGVVLLELITGRPAITKTEEKPHIIQWVGSLLPEREINDIVDSRLQGEFESDSVSIALDTAMACVALSSNNRPNMSQVVVELKQCLAMEMNRETNSNGCTSNSFADSGSHWRTPKGSIYYVSNSIDSISVESSLLRLQV